MIVRDAADDFDQRLDEGVVGGVHLGVEREHAVALAVVGVISFRGDDPVLPAQVTERHVEVFHPTQSVGPARTVGYI